MIKRWSIYALTVLVVTLSLSVERTRAAAMTEASQSSPIGMILQQVMRMNPLKMIFAYLSNIEDANDIEPGLERFRNLSTDKRYYPYGCECENYTCSCCGHVEVNKIRLNETGCVLLSYESQNYTLDISFLLNDQVIYNDSISLNSLPGICFGVPYLEQTASLCLKLYKLDARNRSLSGCADIIARLADVEVARIKLGCFRLGANSTFSKEDYMSIYFNKHTFIYSYDNQTISEPDQSLISSIAGNILKPNKLVKTLYKSLLKLGNEYTSDSSYGNGDSYYRRY